MWAAGSSGWLNRGAAATEEGAAASPSCACCGFAQQGRSGGGWVAARAPAGARREGLGLGWGDRLRRREGGPLLPARVWLAASAADADAAADAAGRLSGRRAAVLLLRRRRWRWGKALRRCAKAGRHGRHAGHAASGLREELAHLQAGGGRQAGGVCRWEARGRRTATGIARAAGSAGGVGHRGRRPPAQGKLPAAC